MINTQISSLPQFQAVSECLKKNGFDSSLEREKPVKKPGWFHTHLATQRLPCVTSLLGKITLTPLCITFGVTALLAHRIGLNTLSNQMLHVGGCIASYTNSLSSLKPLIRTINKSQEKDWNSDLQGVCAGASLYFNFLYTKYAASFSCPNKLKEFLMECADLFVEGAGPEAVALHRAFGEAFDDPARVQKLGELQLLTLIPDSSNSSLEKGLISYTNLQEIKKLPTGPYVLRISNSCGYHALSLIKHSPELCFAFDPAHGLFIFEGEDSPEQIGQFLNTAYSYSRKYNYFRALRKAKALNLPPVQAADLKELYVQILPFSPKASFPSFTPIDLSPLSFRNKSYPMGVIEYIWGSFIDSLKASYY